MKKQKNAPALPKKKVGFKSYIKRYWQLYAMLFLPILYLVIFKYSPMSYIQIAFKKYKLNRSIWEMPLADNFGFEYFIDAFSNPDFIDALRNTIVLNLFRYYFVYILGSSYIIWEKQMFYITKQGNFKNFY